MPVAVLGHEKFCFVLSRPEQTLIHLLSSASHSSSPSACHVPGIPEVCLSSCWTASHECVVQTGSGRELSLLRAFPLLRIEFPENFSVSYGKITLLILPDSPLKSPICVHVLHFRNENLSYTHTHTHTHAHDHMYSTALLRFCQIMTDTHPGSLDAILHALRCHHQAVSPTVTADSVVWGGVWAKDPGRWAFITTVTMPPRLPHPKPECLRSSPGSSPNSRERAVMVQVRVSLPPVWENRLSSRSLALP